MVIATTVRELVITTITGQIAAVTEIPEAILATVMQAPEMLKPEEVL